MKETMQESVEQDSEGTAAHQQDDGTLQPKKAATSAAPIWESFLFFFMVGLLAWGSLALTLMVYQALVRPLAVVPYPHILLSANLLSSGVGITLLLSYRRFYASYQALEERLRKREEEFSHQFHVASITDRLTGLCTLFYFGQRVDEEMERAWRYKHPFVLLVIDLMDFSAINERHGRLSGDLVLRQFAQSVIKGVIRTTDLSARYGGDQFAILL
ncbi:MAG: cph, partial [Dehalococcoidia bacterium]|nr:cph [Dehalococcoidia bacterium]